MAKKATSTSSTAGTGTKKRSTRKTTTKASKKIDINEFFDEIEKRAYEIFEERMVKNIPGDDMSDWIQAENEVRDRYGK